MLCERANACVGIFFARSLGLTVSICSEITYLKY